MKMIFEKTNRGFINIEFNDYNNSKCAIKESSLANHDAIWLGVYSLIGRGYDPNGFMHLTQEHIEALIPILQHFKEHGTLPREELLNLNKNDINLTKPILVDAILGTNPNDTMCDFLTKQNLMRFSGNQRNENWEWIPSSLENKTFDELLTLYRLIKDYKNEK